MQLLRKFFGFFVLEICSCVKFFWLCIAQLDFGLVPLEVCKKLIEKDLRLQTISLSVNSVSWINIYHSLANAVNFILDLYDEYLLRLCVARVLWVILDSSKLPQAHPTLGNHVSQTNGDSVSFCSQHLGLDPSFQTEPVGRLSLWLCRISTRPSPHINHLSQASLLRRSPSLLLCASRIAHHRSPIKAMVHQSRHQTKVFLSEASSCWWRCQS